MQRSVLASKKVLSNWPMLMEVCERAESALFSISEETSVYDQVFFHSPDVLILAESEAGHSGLVVSEKIREEPRFDHTKVVIVSEERSKALEAGANAAGCNLCCSTKDLHWRLPAFLNFVWTPKGTVQFDRAPRFDVESDVELFFFHQSHEAQTLNASRSGLFVLSPVAIEAGTPITLRFTAKNGFPVDVQVRVARRTQFTKAQNGFRFGLGVEIEELDALNMKKLYASQRATQEARDNHPKQN